MRLVLACLCLSSCGFPDPRDPFLSQDTLQAIKLKASETAQWAPWCDGYPSRENCDDGDSLAGALGFGCAVGFKPACDGVSASIKDGQIHRAPNRNDTNNTASRDQLFGFMAAQLSGERAWLSVKNYIKDNGRICQDATDGRCELTPVSLALMGFIHSHLGYTRDATQWFNGQIFGKTLFAQSVTVPTGYQLNLVAEAAYMAWKTGFEDRLSYESAKNVYLRQPGNPWFCYVVMGADESCAQLALALWPSEPEHKAQWSFARDTTHDDWQQSQGWEWLFLSGLFGVDLNLLEYSGKHYSKGTLQPQPAE
jgi:hypothetical protein